MNLLTVKIYGVDGSLLQCVAMKYKPKGQNTKKRSKRLMEQLAFVKVYLSMDPFQKVASWHPTAA